MLAGAHPMSPRRFERVQGLRRVVYDSEDYMEGIKASGKSASRSSRGTKTSRQHQLT